MFEFEIMLTGYTLLVATTTSIIARFVNKKQLAKINLELSNLKNESQKMSLEIKELYRLLKQ